MDKQIIVLSGMPASGKDTVTNKLCTDFPQLVPFKKHRAITDKMKPKSMYFNISIPEFEAKISSGDFLQYHGRYGRYYGIDKAVLFDYFSRNLTPIIHIGRIENYYTLCESVFEAERKHDFNIKLHHILLWETREVLTKRIADRDKTDEEIKKRIAAMEQEFDDNISLMKNGDKPFSVVIKNDDIDETCKKIISAVRGLKIDDGYEEFWRYLKSYD